MRQPKTTRSPVGSRGRPPCLVPRVLHPDDSRGPAAESTGAEGPQVEEEEGAESRCGKGIVVERVGLSWERGGLTAVHEDGGMEDLAAVDAVVVDADEEATKGKEGLSDWTGMINRAIDCFCFSLSRRDEHGLGWLRLGVGGEKGVVPVSAFDESSLRRGGKTSA